MIRTSTGRNITDFDAVRLLVASPQRILEWSHGEVLKPETINYRTQKPERDGLFCERIFGPVKDINPHDPKFKGTRSREMARDEKGEVVTRSIVRRERMGHIALSAPVSHIWFLRGTPSATGLILNMTVKNLEKIVYFASYIVLNVDTTKRDLYLKDATAELEAAKMAIKSRYESDAQGEDANIKHLATQQSKEVQEAQDNFDEKKRQLDSLAKMRLMTESEYRELPEEYQDLVDVDMGARALQKLLKAIDLEKLIEELNEEAESAKGMKHKKLLKRLKMLEGMHKAGIDPASLILTVIPVIPPDLRPMVQLSGGRFATSDLNDLYRRVINRNNRLKKLINLKAPEVICRNEQRMLQEAVDALIDNNNARSGRAIASTGGNRRRLKSLSDMLKGKQGRFRQNLLGKRVDYSGRSVIVSGPELKLSECGLPKMMALELFKPFVIGRLIEQDFAHNIKAAARMIERSETEVWDALDHVIKGKYVLLNRAPTLHRLGIQAFQPKLIEGKAIQLHPLVCKGFNADFDGDQMAVHLPLSRAAQEESKNLMSATRNLLKPADGSPILHIEQDIVLGCYYLTYDKKSAQAVSKNFSSLEEAIFAYDQGGIKLQSPIRIFAKGEIRATTLGRVLYNEVFPEDFAFQNEPTSKKVLQDTMAKVFSQHGEEETARVADDLKDLGFEYATVSGLSTGMDDYSDLDGLDEMLKGGDEKAGTISDQYEDGLITEEERYRLTVKNWKSVNDEILNALSAQFVEEDSSTSVTVESGARGNIGGIKQITGSIGVMVDATGKEMELPIKSNYKDGLSPLEYFTSTKGTRKGMISTALKTADSGYLTRRLVDVSQDVFTASEDAIDPGLLITNEESEERGVSFAHRLTGRVASEAVKTDGKTIVKKDQLITANIAETIIAAGITELKIRSVLTDTSIRGVSPSSYGLDLARGGIVKAAEPIGVIAAQSIGEPGTQLTLDTFHSGGVAGEDISQGLPRIEELFEARNPKGQAFISEIDGYVSVAENKSSYTVTIASSDDSVHFMKLAKDQIVQVKQGAKVTKGDVIAATDEAKKPIVSPADGTVEIFDDEVAVLASDSKIKRYQVPSFKTLVIKDGDKLEAGDRITAGSINLQELFKLKGVEATQRYIMSDVQRIFSSQGQAIADKHLEVVVRQMFSRVQIEEPGGSLFVVGDVISRAALLEANSKLKSENKKQAEFTQLLLGITKVSTWSDSFLSAASFQDTTRVLIAAAVQGKEDELYGLKENVIIGRQIPVGTGARGNKDFSDAVTETEVA
ncbi:DNA-directed RNA polymerase subunit beta' [Candidatus Saccharibacteria bacterium]|jgi:DNA-directed RNA polymerase subunit beta'|nr:DNA-directed RNA polymerase subunit beta' [Candidatus Saccharibacteria bacterium]